jgi:transposase
MQVVIGIDPHKASHTAVAVDGGEEPLSSVKVRATRKQVEQLLDWAEPFGKRRWAIESAGGLGYLLAQQLVARGEEVYDVPPTLASRVRVLATTRSNKHDPNDALSIAVAALRTPRLKAVEAANHTEVLRLVSKRNTDIGSHRTRVVCRLHAFFQELAPGGISKEMNASDAEALLAKLEPTTPTEQVRYDLATELLEDLRRLDAQLKASHRRIKEAVTVSGTSVTEIYGIGPMIATELIGYSGDIRRFAKPRRLCLLQRNRTCRVLLWWPHSAPGLGARLSNAQPRAAHGSHLSDPPDELGRSDLLRTPGGRTQDQEGSDPRSQATPLERGLSPTAPRRPIGGPGGHSGTTRCLRDRPFTLHGRLFGEVTPEPRATLRRCRSR